MKLGMLACCAVMLVPLGAFLLANGTLGGLASNLGLLVPLALCLATHVVMHRMMGKSCHESAAETREEDPEQDRESTAVVQVDAAR
ncbi:hypothetical protein SAMN04490244_10448 [Tranquillimonas rosea]|uniref:DUF2933 domain-containing protein n=2 Tax=Rhodobacterales TaxID=204455 RepID=A0A1H9TA32_9RHOB|nr:MULTISPECIES: DUF2933 domain-containing protein [Rhodobacterales]PTX38357.1 hypothetical protein C8N44_1441 [Allosediminivita pacifica]GGB29368.1 hypothetical protein GCM10011324_43680 [Allosediminivita pacifica]SER93986.1 hypothetical protein SAMN04490244_10448 [Tranquillimonas rosea]